MATITETVDAASNTSTVYTIADGDQFRGTVESTTSTDWIRSVLSVDKSYFWTLTGDGSAGSLTSLRLALFDDVGNRRSSVTDGALAFTPQLGEDVYIQVGNPVSNSGTSGNYRLNLLEEIADSINTTEVLTAGQAVSGRADYSSDRDWYAVRLSSEYSYYFSVSGDGSGAAQTNFDLALFDGIGREVEQGEDSLAFTPVSSGTYYLQNGDAFRNSGQTGNYILNMTQEIGDNVQTRASITAGQTVSGRADYSSDRDWYKVRLGVNDGYYWTLTGDGSGDAQTNFDLALFNSSGTEVASGESALIYTATTAGLYYVQVGDAFRNSGQIGNYELSMVAEVVGNNQARGSIADGQTVSGRAEYSSDRDWFAVSLDGNETHYWTLTGDGSGDAQTNFDLALFDSSGTQVATGESAMAYTATNAGTYYVQVGDAFRNSGQTGNYELSMISELVANVRTQSELFATDDTAVVRNRSDYDSDRDWHGTSLNTTYSYFWTLTGDGSQDALEEFRLALFDANGTELTDGRGVIAFTPTDQGTFYVQTGTGNPGSGEFTGNYVLEQTRETSDAFNTRGRIQIDSSIGDTLDYRGDTDMYRVTLAAGRSYEVTMTGDGSAQSLDGAGLGIFSADGTELVRQGGTADARSVTFTAEDAGQYFIQAGLQSSFFSGGLGTYTLSVSQGTLNGTAGNDALVSNNTGEILRGLDGSDNLVGNGGDDLLIGGESTSDLRDNIFGGEGNDTIRGGYGNDNVRGDAGDDLVEGGFGADTVLGGEGNDSITGSGFGDLLFGGNGDDFVNGGFGFDRINGGDGADEFFHLGVAGHGTDFIQDYDGSEGDVLVTGIAGARADQFQINLANTPNAGSNAVEEAFIIYKPTGQIMWALIDGAAQDEINLQIAGDVFDLTA